MSRVRTGHTPDAWMDLGPQAPHRSPRTYASVPARVGADMTPVIRSYVLSDARRAQNAEAQRKRRERLAAG